MTDRNDQELLERFRTGDVGAFEEILTRYEGPLLRYASRYNRWGAQDIIQEVFLRLVRECRSPERASGSIDHLSAWLYRVTRNVAFDLARKEQRMQRREQQAAVSEIHTPPSAPVETQEMANVVEEKLHGLPPRERDVLLLKIHGRKTYREISEITGLSVSNVGYLIHKGLKALTSELRTAGVV